MMSSTMISEIFRVLTTKTSSHLSYPNGHALSRIALEPLPSTLENIVRWSSVYNSATARKERRAKLVFRRILLCEAENPILCLDSSNYHSQEGVDSMRRSIRRTSDTEPRVISLHDGNQYTNSAAQGERLDPGSCFIPSSFEDVAPVKERRESCTSSIKHRVVSTTLVNKSNKRCTNVGRNEAEHEGRGDPELKDRVVTYRCMYTGQKHKKRKVWSDGAVRCCPRRQRVSLYRWSEVLGVTDKLLGEIYLPVLEYQAFVTRGEPELEMESFIVSLDGVMDNEASIADGGANGSADETASSIAGLSRKRKLLKPFKPPTRRAPPVGPSPASSPATRDRDRDAENVLSRGRQYAPRLGQGLQTQTSYTGFGNVASLWEQEDEEAEDEGDRNQENNVVGTLDPLSAVAETRDQDTQDATDYRRQEHPLHTRPQSTVDTHRPIDHIAHAHPATIAGLLNAPENAGTQVPPGNLECLRDVHLHAPNTGHGRSREAWLSPDRVESGGREESGSTRGPIKKDDILGKAKKGLNEEVSGVGTGTWMQDERGSYTTRSTRSTQDILSLFGGDDESSTQAIQAGVAEESESNLESRVYSECHSSGEEIAMALVPGAKGGAAEARPAQGMDREAQRFRLRDKPEPSTAPITSNRAPPSWTCGVCGVGGSPSSISCLVCGVPRARNDVGDENDRGDPEEKDEPLPGEVALGGDGDVGDPSRRHRVETIPPKEGGRRGVVEMGIRPSDIDALPPRRGGSSGNFGSCDNSFASGTHYPRQEHGARMEMDVGSSSDNEG